MALSMDEQRILEGMERKLADEDPKLASRLTAFGQPRLPALFGSGRARAAAVLISLALAALMALMVYSMRPYATGQGRGVSPNTSPSTHVSSAAKTGAAKTGAAKTGAAKTGGAKTGQASTPSTAQLAKNQTSARGRAS
jgi:hypothetical protein